jgi:hypothetical protein
VTTAVLTLRCAIPMIESGLVRLGMPKGEQVSREEMLHDGEMNNAMIEVDTSCVRSPASLRSPICRPAICSCCLAAVQA